jgi:hypothetical protein
MLASRLGLILEAGLLLALMVRDIGVDFLEDVAQRLDVVALEFLHRRPVEDNGVAGDRGDTGAVHRRELRRVVPRLYEALRPDPRRLRRQSQRDPVESATGRPVVAGFADAFLDDADDADRFRLGPRQSAWAWWNVLRFDLSVPSLGRPHLLLGLMLRDGVDDLLGDVLGVAVVELEPEDIGERIGHLRASDPDGQHLNALTAKLSSYCQRKLLAAPVGLARGLRDESEEEVDFGDRCGDALDQRVADLQLALIDPDLEPVLAEGFSEPRARSLSACE